MLVSKYEKVAVIRLFYANEDTNKQLKRFSAFSQLRLKQESPVVADKLAQCFRVPIVIEYQPSPAGVKAGCARLCRAASKIVWHRTSVTARSSEMACP